MSEYSYKIEHEGRSYDVELECEIEIDRNYGADADGRFGKTIYFVDVEDFKAFEINQDGDDTEIFDNQLLKKLQKKAEDMAVEEYKGEE